MEQPPARVQPPSTNGHHTPTPPDALGGVLYSDPGRATIPAQARPQTVFPPEIPARTLPLILYRLGRGQIGGFSLLRWLWVVGAIAALAALVTLPAGAWIAALLLTALIGVTLAHAVQARRSFVRFTEQPLPSVTSAALTPAEKLPIYVTGTLEVGGRLRPFAWLPGFYRTFATREHALLCQCREQRVLAVGLWPEGETGLWYAFLKPDRIRAVRWGALGVGSEARPALAIDYLPEPNPAVRKRRGVETLYLACTDESSLRRVLADLQVDAVPLLRRPHP